MLCFDIQKSTFQEGSIYKKHTTIEIFIYWIGFFMCMSGFGTSLSPLNYNLFIPNKSTALLSIFIGIAFLLTSFSLPSHIHSI